MAAELRRCLDALRCQQIPGRAKLQIVVVDNQSTDASSRVADNADAVIVSIPKNEFTWGRALNLGIEKTTGSIILLLSADACPADNRWVAKMTEPFTDQNVAAVYGRQLPWPNAPVDERVRLKKTFGEKPARFDKNNKNILPTGNGMIVSNACAAIRKSVWQQLRYNENIEAGEEGLWSYKVIENGFSILYQPLAEVYHSHRDRVFKLAWRQCQLLRKNLLLKRIKSKKLPLRHLAGFAKRRIINCTQPNISFYYRAEGLIRLPLELAAIAIVMLLTNRDFFNAQNRRIIENKLKDIKLKRLINLLGAAGNYIRWRRRFHSFGWRSRLQRCSMLTNPLAISIGKKVSIRKGARLEAIDTCNGKNPKLTIGDGTSIQFNFHCAAAESVNIGKNVLIAGSVYVTDHDHVFDDPQLLPVNCRRLKTAPVVIADGAFLGEGSMILKGVKIGHRAVVAANAVVTKNVPAGSVAAGVPATIIRKIFE